MAALGIAAGMLCQGGSQACTVLAGMQKISKANTSARLRSPGSSYHHLGGATRGQFAPFRGRTQRCAGLSRSRCWDIAQPA